jgi:Zn-dependent protease
VRGRCYDRTRLSPYGSYDNSPLGRVWQVVTRTFAIGTFFGVHVRVYWAALVLPLLFLRWTAPATASGAEAFVLAMLAFVALFVVIWSHEMGHIAAGWRCHIRTDLITLGPLGGVAHLGAPARTPRDELFITLAGPATHLVWLAVFWPLELLLPAQVLEIDGWYQCPIKFTVWFLRTTNLTLLLFNLLPIFPLDGGRVLRALLSLRVHANQATLWVGTLGIVGGTCLVLYGLWAPDLQGAIPVLIGVTCILASIQERRIARHVLIYRPQAQSFAWETDPDAWKRGGGGVAGRELHRPGWFARWRTARVQKKAQARADADAALEREVDTILDRVHRVGMTGLSDREKAVLKRASSRRRGAG